LIESDNVVDVQISISASGKVTAAKLGRRKGPVADALGKTAVSAALDWQFRPATQNGEAVSSDKILEFLFRPSAR
jgi:TonB family protein